jgi:hypothetical protein
LHNWTRAKPFQQLQGKHGERDILFTPLLLIDFWTRILILVFSSTPAGVEEKTIRKKEQKKRKKRRKVKK